MFTSVKMSAEEEINRSVYASVVRSGTEKGNKRKNGPLSHGGHFESQENKKLCFCTSSLALEERLAVQNLLFQHCVIKVYDARRSIEEVVNKISGEYYFCIQQMLIILALGRC